MTEKYDVIIIGGGPAGLTAGIYLGRARLRTLILDKGVIGGQMVLSYKVANYPGVETTSGQEIAQTMLRQAKSFGAHVISQAEITKLDISGTRKIVEVEDEGIFEAPAVILAPGGRPRSLGLDSEQGFKGHGISYCATCDGDFFTDKQIVVVGGGNSALEEAVSLTKYASKVTIVHILPEFQAQPYAVAEAMKNEKIEILKQHRVVRFEGEEKLEGVVVEDVETGKVRTIDSEGCFVFIGYVANTEEFKGILEMNNYGEIRANDRLETNVSGVFVAGDSREKKYRQITTAVSDGTIAALSAIEYVQEHSAKDSTLSNAA